MAKKTYTTPVVADHGQATANTLGGSRINLEGSVKQP